MAKLVDRRLRIVLDLDRRPHTVVILLAWWFGAVFVS
jgi:hypothetical protein